MNLSTLLATLALTAMPLLGPTHAGASLADEDPQFKSLLNRTTFFVDEFDKEVQRAQGGDNRHYHNKTEALSRVKELIDKYPNEPESIALRKRVSSILMRSKGDFLEITPEMVAYKDAEKNLREKFSAIAVDEWNRLLASHSVDASAPIFPAPDVNEVSMDDLRDKYVVIPGVEYPMSMFVGSSGSYIAVGKPSSGYYFIEASGRSWVGPYEAIKRHRRQIDSSIGEQMSFTVLGRVTSVVTEIPEAEEEKHGQYQWGWTITPEALYIDGKALGIYDRNVENSGRFAGEEQAEEIKNTMYTVRSVPENASPDQVMAAFCTAIKEKNYKLYESLINPERRKTPTALSLLRYHWDLHQQRFADEYVTAVFGKPKITVEQGFDESNDLEAFFLDNEQKDAINKMSGVKIERATVESKAYDGNGKQKGSPNKHTLIRTNSGRWYVEDYPIRF